jgi:hypothetical protein
MSARDRIDDRLIAALRPLVAGEREKASRLLVSRRFEALGPPEPDFETLLRSELAFAAQQYEVEPWAEAQAEAMTLHEVAGPIDTVLTALQIPANDGAIYAALGSGDAFSIDLS